MIKIELTVEDLTKDFCRAIAQIIKYEEEGGNMNEVKRKDIFN